VITGTPYRRLSFFERFRYPRQIDFDNALNHHAVVAGMSGTGKSSLLKVMALQEFNHSVVLIDTHRDAFIDTLHACIELDIDPSRVIIIDPTTPQYGTIILDPLRIAGVDPYVCVDSLLAACRGVWRDAWGARMEDCLRRLFLTLQATNLPLSAGLTFLEDEKMHRLILTKVNDPELENFWQYFFKYHRADIESSRNKLSSFLLNPFVKPMFDRAGSNIDFYDAFKNGKIILINLSRNYFKDDSSRGFLGAIFLSMVYNALLQRENDKERRSVVILADEVHEYYIPEFVNPFLTGGRKYGAGLKMFTQSLGHFKPHDLEIIFSTVGSIISFAVGYADAKRLVDELFTFRNDAIVKHQKRDMFGGYGDKTFYSAGEQRQHALTELMEQAQREVLVRVKKRHGNETYIGQVTDVPEFQVSPEEESEYRRESAKHHGYTNP